MKYITHFIAVAAIALTAGLYSFAAAAQQHLPEPWQLNFQPAASPVMERLSSLHGELLYIIIAVSLFVLLLLVIVVLRFNEKTNPTPSKTSHNTALEIVWTAIPVAILVYIAVKSLPLHYYMDKAVDADMTLKIVGYQWYWHYEYPDHGGFGFDSYMVKDENLKPGEPRLLTVDNKVVVPVDTTVRVQLTAGDVIHAWAMPAMGVKIDAVPGRLNETWFKATKLGTFYGQCSELCGVGHGFMPIELEVVTREEFARWVEQAKQEFANDNNSTYDAYDNVAFAQPENLQEDVSNE